MAYTLDYAISLGSNQTGLTLAARLVDTDGANTGSEITTGFTEIGDGNYHWHYASFPDDHRGGVKFYEDEVPGVILAFASINPEEAEHTAAILADTNELQSDLTDGGRLDLILDGILEDTGTTLDTLLNTLVTRLTAARAAKLDNVDQAISTTQTNIVGADGDTLKSLSDQMDNKTGYKLAADGLDSITATESSGKPTNFREWVMWLVQRFRRSKMDRTAGTITVEQEDGTAVTEQTFSDDGTTQQLGGPSDV